MALPAPPGTPPTLATVLGLRFTVHRLPATREFAAEEFPGQRQPRAKAGSRPPSGGLTNPSLLGEFGLSHLRSSPAFQLKGTPYRLALLWPVVWICPVCVSKWESEQFKWKKLGPKGWFSASLQSLSDYCVSRTICWLPRRTILSKASKKFSPRHDQQLRARIHLGQTWKLPRIGIAA